jgi:hypothetical protein
MGVQWEGTSPNLDILRLAYQLDDGVIVLVGGVGGTYASKSVPWSNKSVNTTHHLRLEVAEVAGTLRPTILAFKGYSDGVLVLTETEETLGINLSGLPARLHPSFSVATYRYSSVNQVFDNLVVRTKFSLGCVGFESPLSGGPVTVNKSRALPFKAKLFDRNGVPVTDLELGAARPVIQVLYSAGTQSAIDVTEFSLPAGQSTSGNQFVFSEGKWHYNLLTKDFTAPGVYTVTMGPGGDYVIEPTCIGSFLLK